MGTYQFVTEHPEAAEVYDQAMTAITLQAAPGVAKRYDFAEGERIHTEYSYKYDAPALAVLAERGAFRVAESWTDAERLFSVVYLECLPEVGSPP